MSVSSHYGYLHSCKNFITLCCLVFELRDLEEKEEEEEEEEKKMNKTLYHSPMHL